MKVVVEADGGSRGNPGPAGYGAVVRHAETGEVLAERAEAIGTTTNNVAEYRGLIAGLVAAAELGATEVDVRMDSKLVVEQMSGRWQIKHPGLRPLAAEAARAVRAFDTVRYTWIPRERNKHADGLANAAMDRAAGRPAKPVRDIEPTQLTGGAVSGPGAAEAARTVAAPDSPARARAREVAARAATPTARAATPTARAATPTARVAAPPEPATESTAGRNLSWAPRPSEHATRLLLIRHGETERTVQKRYSGREDVPLTERGRAQARAVAARVAGLGRPVAAVLSSPLARCTATARLVARAVGDPPVLTEPDLVECDFGDWEGRTFAEVREEWPTELDAWLASPEVAPPGGESFRAVARRVGRVAASLPQRYPGETIVVVSHVTPVKIVLRDALDAGDAFLHRLYLDPAGLSIVDFWPDGGVAVRTVNDTAHLVDR